MKSYEVTFTQYSTYGVEANNEREAVDKAYHEFCRDASYPVANTHYDEVDVEEIEDEDEE